MSDKEILTPEEKVAAYFEWTRTPEAELQRAIVDVALKQMADRLAKAYDISWEKLHAPFTI